MDLDRVRGLRQPDQRSCGPSSLVAARMLVHPEYHPVSFGDDVLALHRRIAGLWPRALGTPPWAVASAMAGVTGVAYRTHVVRWGDRTADYLAVWSAVTAGRPCPLYVGTGSLPRHVVLAVTPADDGIEVYNPADGELSTTTRTAFEGGELTTGGRFTRLWFSVTPRRPAPRSAA